MKKFLCALLCVLLVSTTGCVLFPEKVDWAQGDYYELLDNEYAAVSIIKHTDIEGRQTFTFEVTNKKDCGIVCHISLISINADESAGRSNGSNVIELTLAPNETVISEEGLDFSSADVEKIEKLKIHVGTSDEQYYKNCLDEKTKYQFSGFYEITLGDDIAIDLSKSGW